MDNTKAWEVFFCTGRVCDYLQYKKESRLAAPMQLGAARQRVDEGERKAPCNVSRTE